MAYLLNYLYLIVVAYLNRAGTDPPYTSLKDLPDVTIQLPIYNEMYVVERLIKAVCSLEYPKEKLQIVVIDDSDDLTSVICNQMVKHYKNQGYDIHLIRRNERVGYKAGALQEALKVSKGDLIAIFDADFIPLRIFF